MVAKRDNVVGQRVQAPAHDHNPLEIWTDPTPFFLVFSLAA